MTAARALDFYFREGPTVFFTAETTWPWVISSISENVETQLGIPASEIRSEFFPERLHPDDLDRATDDAARLLHNGRAPFLYRVRRSDGTYVLVQGEFCLLRDERGRNQAVVGYWTDRTEQERARAVLSAIPDAIFEVDQEGKFSFFHAKPLQTYVDPSRIIGATLHELLPKDVADLLLNAVKRALASRESQVVKYALPFDSEWRHYQAHLGTSLSQDTAVAIVRDITDDVLHESALRTQKRYLEEANASLEQFVYVASHDLREPLIGVAGFATLLQKRYGAVLDEQGNHFVEEVVSGTKNLEAKIDDLLALSRVSRGNNSGTFALGAAIESAKRCLVGQLNKTPVEFKLPEVMPLVRGDRGQITQVFQNLFSNSIKYRKVDVPTVIEVSVKEDSSPGMLLVSVTDNGIGFDQRHAERIFGVFQRLYTPQQYPGTGIGLAIVRKIVERHGGKVSAVSEPNQGSTFFFTVPKA